MYFRPGMQSASLARTALVALALASSACSAPPPPDVAPNVDLSRFAGKWYEIARLPRPTQTDCHGTTAFYTLAPDGSLTLVSQCNVGSGTGPLKTVSMVATVPEPSVPAKLTLDVAGFAGDYWILEVGPTYEYAVVGHPSREYLWILSRTPTLDATTTSGILSHAHDQQFDTSRLEFTPQPPGDERASLSGPEGPVPPPLTTGCSISRSRTRDGGTSLAVILIGLALRCRRRSGRSRK